MRQNWVGTPLSVVMRCFWTSSSVTVSSQRPGGGSTSFMPLAGAFVSGPLPEMWKIGAAKIADGCGAFAASSGEIPAAAMPTAPTAVLRQREVDPVAMRVDAHPWNARSCRW